MDKVIEVSIIIVNYNTLHVLRPCLDSIVEQTHGVAYEIIVVDNGSTDGSSKVLATDERITFVPTGENLGFGRANNVGLAHAKGEYILFLNSDTFLRNNAIKQMLDFARNYDGQLGALGCVLESRLGEPVHSYGPFPKMSHDWTKLVWTPIKKALHLYREPVTALPDNWMTVDYVTGADLFVNREVLNICGAFHPAFFMYCEESEMQRRFCLQGYDNVLMVGPRIVHLEGESSKEEGSSKFIRDCLRQQKSEYIYFKLTEPKWKYRLYRLLHPVLRQTLWLNPHVSFADKKRVAGQLFVKIDLPENNILA